MNTARYWLERSERGWILSDKRAGMVAVARWLPGKGWRALPKRAFCAAWRVLGRVPSRAGAPFRVAQLLADLALPSDYNLRHDLPLQGEPTQLRYAGLDRYQRPVWLASQASRAWQHMRAAGLRDGVALELISGFRSIEYQAGIIARKRARGLDTAQILESSAAPGYSEHHSGCALDFAEPGEPALTEAFENTPSFAWLSARAAEFGFVMSYPRDNPHQIAYEPWHWRYSTIGGSKCSAS